MKSIQSLFKIMKYDLSNGENLDAYVAILIGIVITILDLFNAVPPDVVTQSMMLVMTLLVFGYLSIRHTNKLLNDAVSKINPKANLLSNCPKISCRLGGVVK